MAARSSLLSKIRGCLVGSLAGDCLGHPFETRGGPVSRSVLEKYLSGLQDPNLRVPYKPYTDDTAMTRNVARSLLECKGYDAKDMAMRFVQEYKKDPKRDYGEKVVIVFSKLDFESYENPYRPAKEQFEGQGSYGNGAAMRVSPVALYYWNDLSRCLEVARDQSRITHYNWVAVLGAVLQCAAVFHAVHWKDNFEMEPSHFLKNVSESLLRLVDSEEQSESLTESVGSYTTKLEKVLNFLGKPNPSPEHVAAELGNGVSALESVPTAIYSFLRSVKETGDSKELLFCQTLFNAILVGGDTDTIASMAGAICGAYVGLENMNETLLAHLEDREGSLALAEELAHVILK